MTDHNHANLQYIVEKFVHLSVTSVDLFDLIPKSEVRNRLKVRLFNLYNDINRACMHVLVNYCISGLITTVP